MRISDRVDYSYFLLLTLTSLRILCQLLRLLVSLCFLPPPNSSPKKLRRQPGSGGAHLPQRAAVHSPHRERRRRAAGRHGANRGPRGHGRSLDTHSLYVLSLLLPCNHFSPRLGVFLLFFIVLFYLLFLPTHILPNIIPTPPGGRARRVAAAADGAIAGSTGGEWEVNRGWCESTVAQEGVCVAWNAEYWPTRVCLCAACVFSCPNIHKTHNIQADMDEDEEAESSPTNAFPAALVRR